ncbi:MAG TPA: TrkA family potassium uptake protein [Planctomycetes bacterium]|nr:TrkA family potassium uptake protein [Planctomycetota bacterium]
MYVIIAGGGIAGSTLAKEFADRRHDVVVIEQNKSACEDLYAHTGAVTIHGSALDIRTIKEAGAEKADLAIGALYKDADNLTFAILAHTFKIPKIIVKMRDPAYEEAFRAAGVDTVCDMIQMLRSRVMAEVETPNLQILAPLKAGQARLVMFHLPHALFPEGVMVRDLVRNPAFGKGCLFAGILHSETGKLVLPRGDDRIGPGDQVFAVLDTEGFAQVSGFLAQALEESREPARV